PVDAGALSLRRERYQLAQRIHTIAAVNGKAVELRVLQYGVTRERLGEVLVEADGWDVVHVSGHGLPAGLLLEHADGRGDLISSPDLVELLAPGRGQVKLVTVSSCSSAALTAAEHLRLLGITDPDTPRSQPAAAEPDGAALPALEATLGCAVLAMRYPVADEFAIGLAARMYGLLLGKGQPLPRALQLALPKAVAGLGEAAALSAATPALFGTLAADLRLLPPAGKPVVFDEAETKLAGFPADPKRFVGRVGPLARANAALAPGSGHSGVLFVGMAGAGKTACALELAYGHEQGFARLVWHKAPDEGRDVTSALTNLAMDLERKLPGLHLVEHVEDPAGLAAFLPQLTEWLERHRVLVVVDNVESLLTKQGDWRDPRWSMIVGALAGHGGLSRLILGCAGRGCGNGHGWLLESLRRAARQAGRRRADPVGPPVGRGDRPCRGAAVRSWLAPAALHRRVAGAPGRLPGRAGHGPGHDRLCDRDRPEGCYPHRRAAHPRQRPTRTGP
ncbi:MAG: CHAT domain-containing protein, partial [Egibacteraceae bacterium]